MLLYTRFYSAFFLFAIVCLRGFSQGVPCVAPMPGTPGCYQTSRPNNGNPLVNFPPLPHQDCCNAIGIINPINFIENGSLIPEGGPIVPPKYPGCVPDELPADANTCFNNNEQATTWYKFRVKPLPGGPTAIGAPAGLLRFKIVPTDVYDDPDYDEFADDGFMSYGETDYDFLLFQIPADVYSSGNACAAIKGSPAYGLGSSVIKRCNWAGTRGPTGLFEPGTGIDAATSPAVRFNKPLPVRVGDIFILAIDDFSTNPQDFFLDFRGIGAPDDTTARLYSPDLFEEDANLITGTVFQNQDNDCAKDPFENTLSNRLIKAMPGHNYGMTNASGQYAIRTPGGSFSVSQLISPFMANYQTQYCPASNGVHTVNFGGSVGDTASGIDFANNLIECPFVTVGVTNGWLRRCAKTNIQIRICNQGLSPTDSATTVHFKLPKYVVFQSANRPYTYQASDSSYRFKIGSLNPNACITINTIDSVTCVAGIMNQTVCAAAWVTPGNTCIPNPPLWDGVDLAVRAKCSGPVFTIVNKGAAMTSRRPYRVYVDSMYAYTDSIQLAAGDSIVLQVPASSSSLVRLEINQSAHHPTSHFTASEISCSGNVGSVVYYNPPDESPVEDMDCDLIRDSYDPNIKEVCPQGVAQPGYIVAGRPLEYTIHFQNTGNDVAYNVVVVDSLDADLDLSTFELLGASHNFTMQVSGRGRPVLSFRFDNIMLPDSASNPLASNGFVSFSINTPETLGIGTELRNRAFIYFDFNPPIITNYTINTIYNPMLIPGILDTVFVVGNRSLQSFQKEIKLYPNPGHGMLHIAAPANSGMQSVALSDMQGRKLIQHEVIQGENDEPVMLDIDTLPTGLYFVEIETKSGKVVKRWMKQR